MTPAEHDQEKNVIHGQHRPFVDGIEECIQRFRARRRMAQTANTCSPGISPLAESMPQFVSFKALGTWARNVLGCTSKAVARETTADDAIQRGGEGNRNHRFYNPNSPEHWDVDFIGVAAGFLDFRIGTGMVSNVLKYVDMHDVCPEYAEDIESA
ncbi:Argonaute-binding protein 1 [Madurella mycetomatis]|uniref:Argonaute-binding protein 1 n=1 Tax=Madurella mycetomatis TaxID=100816 RepID=A0A175VN98_9PEZI|nr:Argonaute-binding protein 1 [Madurella mycetomatis]